MNKFTEKTPRNLTSATPVGWTGGPETPEYCCILLVEIATHIPVIFPDTVHVISSLKQNR